jgi:peptidoglycan/xylan/chitin deacetylase (PgdA/CDA1 family)
MSSLSVRLTRGLRDIPLARAAVVRWRTLGLSQGGAEDGVLILCYHGMRAADRGRFERQIHLLRDLGDVIGLSDVVRMLNEGRDHDGRIGGRFICLTFDDGYTDAFDNAFPILAAQNVPAAFFVISGWVDESRPGIIGWSQCRDLAAAGMEIGSHSVTHPHLATLPQSEVEAELTTSRARIEAELGRPCLHFACPYGQPDEDYQPEREPALSRAAGYQSFLTTIPRRAHAGADPWALPRVRMEPGWGAAELRYAFSR